ncbi:MAG TPA: glycosyl hydrolase family 28-related protein [Geminicoccaceae bacterium]|nr:glycosyl hydrolase family 28-related protein [Geminicoccaceae bacterium]
MVYKRLGAEQGHKPRFNAMPLIPRALLIAAMLVLGCGDAQAAGMRGFQNVPLSKVPPQIVAGQGGLLEVGYLDVTRAPYHADSSGQIDASAALQAAIDDGYAYNFAVYVPKGTYLLERPIKMVQRQNYNNLGGSNRKFANQLIGDTTDGDFPVLKARDGSLNGQILINIYFEGTNAPTRHYNSLIRGFIIDMGNNPTSTALSLNGAQYCSIEDIVIRGANFNVGIHNLPGSGGSTTNVEILGGNIGIQQSDYRPTPSVHSLALINQRKHAIHHTTTRGALILAGFRIQGRGLGYVAINTPLGSRGQPSRNLVLVDGSIELSDGARVAIDSKENSLYLRNVYVKAPIISRNGKNTRPVDELIGDAGVWMHISEYAFAAGGDRSPLVIDGVASGSVDAEHWLDITPVPGAPDDLLQHHAWDAATFPTYFNREVLDIRDFGATPDRPADDDAPSINQALLASVAEGKPVFVPRGFFHIRSPVEVPAGAIMLGSSYTNSVIMASPEWRPSARTAIVRTEDAQGDVLLVDLAINGHEGAAKYGLQSHKHIAVFHGRTSNMLLRDVQINRREYWKPGRGHYDAPVAWFTGNAGGRIYNLALDLFHGPAESMSPGHRMILIEGTSHPLAIYQPNAEGTENDPQTEIRSASNVTWYGFKFEHRDELLHIVDSNNIAILGGSGNYHLPDRRDDSIFEVNNSSDVVIAIVARQGAAGGYAFVREDGTVRVPGSRKLVSLYKLGDPVPFGENDPPEFPVGSAGAAPPGG